MTEYDYSPEAHEAYNRKLRQIDRWRRELTQYQPANPFKPLPGEHSEDEGGDYNDNDSDYSPDPEDDYVRVDPQSAEAVNGLGRGRRSRSLRKPAKTKGSKSHRSQSMSARHHQQQRPPFITAPPPPPLPLVPDTLALPNGTAIRSYSSPAKYQYYQQPQVQQQQQPQYQSQAYQYATKGIYAPQPTSAPPHQPLPRHPHPKSQQQQYLQPSSAHNAACFSPATSHTVPSPPPYSNARLQPPPSFGVQHSGGMASQSTTALGSTTTGSTLPVALQQQPQPQYCYVPQSLPNGGVYYVPQMITTPPRSPAMMSLHGPQPAGPVPIPIQWAYYGLEEPKDRDGGKERGRSGKSFFGALLRLGKDKRSKSETRGKVSRRDSY